MKNYTFPLPATANSTILIVSTARKVQLEELQFAIQWLEQEGFQYELSPYLFEVDHQFAGTDELRRKSLQWALDHPSGRVIWCVRGGYGTARILDGLNWDAFVKTPKWISGYSDVTALHGTLQRLGFASIHSGMAVGIDTKTPETLSSMKSAWQNKPVSIACGPHELNVSGSARGPLIGGNLSVLYSILSSDSQPELEGAILFMEDLDEYLYHIDRMMLNLTRNGWWEKVAGVVIGGMSDMNDNAVPFGETAEQIIARHLGENIPVAFGFPVGHETDNRAITFGAQVELTVDASGAKVDFEG